MIDARRIAESIAASFCCFRWSVTATLVALILGGVSNHNAFSQVASPTPSPQSSPSSSQSGVPTKEQDEQSKLTEGLLELLGKPENEKSGAGNASGPTADSARNKNAIQPKDSPANPPKQAADPRSMGTNDANPLAVVRDNMHSAASMMQQGRSDQQTVKLQDEIVKRLDDLILQLEQQDQSMQRSSQKKKQQSQQSSSTKKQPPQAKPQSKQSQEKSDSSTEQGNEAADGPGSSGKQANANVRTSDPAALQQSVWGHLPTRTRSQMQSRMVEEFLPSYRERIEAYYRALLEEGERK